MTVRVHGTRIDSTPALTVRVHGTRISAQTGTVRVHAARIRVGGGTMATMRVHGTRITTVPTAAPMPDTVLWRDVAGQLRSWDTYTTFDLD